MKTEFGKSVAGKVSWSLVMLVVLGGAFVTGIADLSGSGALQKLFVFFLGAILVVQIIPALMLLSAMLKGVRSAFSKKAHQEIHK
jgi:hypothetical protein